MSKDIFSWSDESLEDFVVIPTTQGVAAYISDTGYLIIRQERELGEDDDVIMIHPRDIDRFISAIKKLKD